MSQGCKCLTRLTPTHTSYDNKISQKVTVSWKNMSYSKTSSVQSLSGVRLLACPNSCPSSQWCHPTIYSSVFPFSSHLQSFPAAGSFQINQFFASDGQSYWSFSFSISPPNEYSGLISFRIYWLDLLEVQGTLKSLLQHDSSKASILQGSAFFIVQLSHPHMTTGKSIALIRWTFVSKVMSLFFNMLSRLVIAFFPRSKRLLISWLHSPSAVILEPPKIVCHCFHCFPIYFSRSDGTNCHGLSFLNVKF